MDIRLPGGPVIPILYEDRAVLALDKPAGWMLAPSSWDRTARNLQLALESALRRGAFWARARNLKFLRHIHRLDADTSGVLLLAKSPGALRTFSRLFESRQVEKSYLAVVCGVPAAKEWTCSRQIGRDPARPGRMKIDGAEARQAVTHFVVLEVQKAEDGRRNEGPRLPANLPVGRPPCPVSEAADAPERDPQPGASLALVLAQPQTGRTHQIRLHLAASGHPVCGDVLYGAARETNADAPLALRAVQLRYADPFQNRPVRIEAPWAGFVRQFGFRGDDVEGRLRTSRAHSVSP
jgi:23S rRNA-/tRNA-specific pseudouridylate synthase